MLLNYLVFFPQNSVEALYILTIELLVHIQDLAISSHSPSARLTMSFARFRIPNARLIIRQLSTSATRHQSSIPYISTCPAPTCTCAPMPPNLDIDRKTPLLNSVATYNEQVILCTGKEDWSSRIEEEKSVSGDFIRGLRSLIGRGGEGFDPYKNILLTASSFPESPHPSTATILLFPSFLRLTLPPTPSLIRAVAHALLGANLHVPPEDDCMFHIIHNKVQTITKPAILICGHGGRDARCGAVGPILRDEFVRMLERKGVDGDVALISHVGGHKYAGNVIIYHPSFPALRTQKDREEGRMSGAGIWYGRVEPRHVEGLVEETVMKGRIIEELFRGGVMRRGEGGETVDLGRMFEEQIRRERGEEGGLRLRPRARA
ncbi:hypothetical protein CC78DRAFT_294868 [Lojkania enalia]|uniref:Altered inheritance of mitochondria protein 32 n=1 Tax=Lojkania enalia TaxID=147567 RepID=A0A9P4K753_9PLEO|nr:hypothetical protein CC78DRAFT_294868 [Didymosphaeria enalia]